MFEFESYKQFACLFALLPQPGESEVTFALFESSEGLQNSHQWWSPPVVVGGPCVQGPK